MEQFEFEKEFENEEWRTIPEYESYEVSNLGRVRSIERIDNIGRKQKGKLLAPFKAYRGYLKVRLSKEGKTRSFFLHRLVAQAFVLINGGEIEVNHLNGDRKDCRACNLEWCTKSDNIQHAYDTGLRQKKLSDKDVNFIRKNYKPRCEKYGATALAKKYGVTKAHIHNILSGKCQPRNFKQK